ncbi:TetR/AcrR family transcriptional regulator [Nocardioides sp. NPDC051685]|uniref:TetR/AcrR family transcriptional regulator n=1 Tax=Nocardioides sp. NPDC051685 TaxID=3364334 RepID=UPI00378E84B5
MAGFVRGRAELDTRGRILSAAAELLPRFTIAKLTMEDVARAAGIARQTVYKHFRSKDDLVAELIAMELRANHGPLMRDLARKEPSAEGLVVLFMEQLTVGRQFPLIDPVLDPAIAPRMAELIFGVPAVLEALEEIWLPILGKYSDAGVIRHGVEHRRIVRWITYQQFWLITHPDVLAKTDDDLEPYVRDFILGGFLQH